MKKLKQIINNNKKIIYGKNSIMKMFIIILFLIFILFISITIKIEIRKIEIINRKIKFNIKIKLYILNIIKIFQKRITKRNLKRIINMSKKQTIFKDEKKILRSIEIEFENVNLQIIYPMKNPILASYIYAILQGISNIGVALSKIKKKEIEIKNINKGTLYIYFNTCININIAKTILKIIRNLKIKINKKVPKNI